MSLVPSDDVIEQIAATAFHPALGHSVLPRTPDRGAHAGDLHRARGGQYLQAVFLVVIEEQEFRGGLVRKGLYQLLRDPGAGGMPSDVGVQNLSPVMANN